MLGGEWRAGADAEWEVRPGLVLDATVRPDFAQVEADEENEGIFDFGTRGSYETPPFLIIFSRCIGTEKQGCHGWGWPTMAPLS